MGPETASLYAMLPVVAAWGRRKARWPVAICAQAHHTGVWVYHLPNTGKVRSQCPGMSGRRRSRPLKLFWSRGRERNAGDWFSPLICERLSGRRIRYADPRTCDLVAVGSVLGRLNRSHPLHRLGLARRLDVWGTGSLRADDRLQTAHRLHAVRGRLTARSCAQLEAAPSGAEAVFSPRLGDPGLLAHLLLDRPIAKRHGTGVVPHLMDRGHPALDAFLFTAPYARVLDIRMSVPDLLAEIARCERILSSSLHGLVFADALGIPNRWIILSGALQGGRHKFDDYYSAFAIEQQPLRLLEGRAEAAFADYHRPGIEELKRGLLDCFPCR